MKSLISLLFLGVLGVALPLAGEQAPLMLPREEYRWFLDHSIKLAPDGKSRIPQLYAHVYFKRRSSDIVSKTEIWKVYNVSQVPGHRKYKILEPAGKIEISQAKESWVSARVTELYTAIRPGARAMKMDYVSSLQNQEAGSRASEGKILYIHKTGRLTHPYSFVVSDLGKDLVREGQEISFFSNDHRGLETLSGRGTVIRASGATSTILLHEVLPHMHQRGNFVRK